MLSLNALSVEEGTRTGTVKSFQAGAGGASTTT